MGEENFLEKWIEEDIKILEIYLARDYLDKEDKEKLKSLIEDFDKIKKSKNTEVFLRIFAEMENLLDKARERFYKKNEKIIKKALRERAKEIFLKGCLYV